MKAFELRIPVLLTPFDRVIEYGPYEYSPDEAREASDAALAAWEHDQWEHLKANEMKPCADYTKGQCLFCSDAAERLRDAEGR